MNTITLLAFASVAVNLILLTKLCAERRAHGATRQAIARLRCYMWKKAAPNREQN